MTNSMNNVNFVQELVHKNFTPVLEKVIDQYQVWFEVQQGDVHHLLSVLKTNGWKQLSYLSAIDWPEENKFELVYIVMNWDKPVHIQIRTKIDRENPVMDSILPIFPGAKYYERECHEFFGVKFPGNPDFEKQLILENWDDIPPLRKDFDPQAYSDRKFPSREYTETYVVTNGEPSKQVKRAARKSRSESLRTKGGQVK
ncbi:MAG: NADH-quinone oxidoreductase subunit C [Candidatus Izemoplasmatales bacterium]|nr:NADH-quinone oxidoreductase subunit C [Candidatus Izemoplasmatales bacterium]